MNEPEHLLRNLFAEALEISDARQRAAFLDRECGADANLRREVEELIQADADCGHFLPEKPATIGSCAALREIVGALGQNNALPTAPPTERPGDHIGRYQLLEKIGEGGCGIVYLAQQDEPVRRRVALKVIKLGMDTKSVVARFEAERQALALMDHANIARVFDAGATDTGRPFFVMELVRGARITDYCDQRHLSMQARLELFIQVCQAVQHAHQKGIIHRDLKPSNILVTVSDGMAEPKVIDFGIAKATEGRLTDQTLFTAFEQFIGTPAYMSPEQATTTSQDVDTRSDIYSLGVLLYELLTGMTPFDSKELLAAGLDEMRKTICEKEPLRPSTRLTKQLTEVMATRESAGDRASDDSGVLTSHRHHHLRETIQLIRGDLDWIVMKCLEKDRARRYETASGLAGDLRRYLNNEPVSARPPSRFYQFQKTVHRHRVAFTAAAAVIVAMLAGVMASTWQAIRATRSEREQARLRGQAEAESYTSDINLCYQDWEEGRLASARARLEAHFPKPGQQDLRGFEWRYLWNLCRDESLHSEEFEADDPVAQLATTPAHSFVAAACKQAIRLVDPSTGRELSHLSYPNPNADNPHPLVALASGATNLLVAHRAGGVVGLWDLASEKPPTTFQPFTNNISVMALSPDGRYFAAADRNSLGLYGTGLGIWDISLPTQPPRRVWYYSENNGVMAINFSPDGKVLVAALGLPAGGLSIGSWEAKTGHPLKSIAKASTGIIDDLAFSPDGSLLASAGVGGQIKVWNFADRTFKNDLDGHPGNVRSLSFSGDGTELVSSGSDGTIRRWDISSGKQNGLWRLGRGGDIPSVLAPKGKTIVSALRNEVKIWNSEARQPAAAFTVPEGWGSQIVSPDNKNLAVSDPKDLDGSRGASVWDLASGRHKFDLASKGTGFQMPAFSPDGRYFALGSYEKDGFVAVWDTTDWHQNASRREPIVYLTNGFESAYICFSPDGKLLAAAGLCFPPNEPKEPSGATNRLAFWKVGSWERMNLLPQAGIGATEWAAAASVDFSPNGRLVAVGSRDGWVHLWDRQQRRLLSEFKEHEFAGFGVLVAFSSDNRWLVSNANLGPSLVLYDLSDLEHARLVPLIREESGGICAALFTPDNKSLISVNGDGLIKFWNLQSRKLALTLRQGRGPGGFVALAPDGTFLVSRDANGVVKVWPAPSLAEIDRNRKDP